jgi:hypothetical protein
MFVGSFAGPSEDHFADHLTLPEGLDLAEPIPDPSGKRSDAEVQGTDAMQIAVLEKEFSQFLQNPASAVAMAKNQSRNLAMRIAGTTDQPFQLLEGCSRASTAFHTRSTPANPAWSI